MRAAFSTHGHPAGQRAHTELTGGTQGLLSASPCSFPCTLLSGFLSQLRSQSLCKPQARGGKPLSSCRHIPPRTTKGLVQGLWAQKKGIILKVLLLASLSSSFCSSPEPHCLLHTAVDPWSQRCGSCHQPLPKTQESLMSTLLIAPLHSSPSQSYYNVVKE